jgi:hypothetical protein
MGRTTVSVGHRIVRIELDCSIAVVQCLIKLALLDPRGASFTSVEQLRKHDAFIDTNNETAKPFVWTKAKVHQKRLSTRFADQ